MTDSKGLKQGSWEGRDSSGQLSYKGSFLNGKPMGMFTYYYPKGSIKAILSYSSGGQVATAKTYFELMENQNEKDAKMLSEGRFVGEKKDSLWKFYNAFGTLISKENYKNGLKDGSSFILYPSGKIMEEKSYKNGLEDGKFKQFFEAGKIKSEGNYKAGFFDGKYSVYFPDGKLNIVGNYAHAVKHGAWTYFDESGKIIHQLEYKLGKLKDEQKILGSDSIQTEINKK